MDFARTSNEFWRSDEEDKGTNLVKNQEYNLNKFNEYLRPETTTRRKS